MGLEEVEGFGGPGNWGGGAEENAVDAIGILISTLGSVCGEKPWGLPYSKAKAKSGGSLLVAGVMPESQRVCHHWLVDCDVDPMQRA